MGKSASGVVQVRNIPEKQAMRGTRPLRQCSRHHNYRLAGESDFNDYAACTGLEWTEWLPANLEMFVAQPLAANASSKTKQAADLKDQPPVIRILNIEPACRCTRKSESFAQRLFLFSDYRPFGRHISIELFVVGPFFWQIIFMEDCFNRTLWNACFTVNAFIRVNHEDSFTFVKALNWANNDTVGVLTVETGFRDDVSHCASLSCADRFNGIQMAKLRSVKTRNATLIGRLATTAEPFQAASLNSLEFVSRPEVARDRSSVKSECQDSNLLESLSFSSGFQSEIHDAGQAAALAFSLVSLLSSLSDSFFLSESLSIARIRSNAFSN